MKVSILMVTYRKDFDFACYAMQSTAKFATGFHECILVVPHEDVEMFSSHAFRHGFKVRGFDERTGKGMLHHQVIICEADRWCPEADAVLHQDADCLFTSPVTPADFMTDGRPVLFGQLFEDLQDTARWRWRQAVIDAIGITPEWETMVRHPLVHVRETYAITRLLIGLHTGQDWMEYVLSCRNEFPQTFAEFPTLGTVALKHFPEKYDFIGAFKSGDKWHWPIDPGPSRIKDFWSHGGLQMVNDRHPGQTAEEAIADILK